MEIKKKFISLSEAAEKTGISRSIISHKVQRGKLPDAIKVDNIWYISNEDLLLIVEQNQNKKQPHLISVSEASKLCDVTYSVLFNYIRTNRLPGVQKIENKYYLTENDIKFIKSIRNVDISPEYMRIKDAAKKANVTHAVIKSKIYKKKLPDAMQQDGHWYISESDLKLIIDENNKKASSNIYSLEDASRITHFTVRQLKSFINKNELCGAIKLKGKWHITQKDIDWISQSVLSNENDDLFSLKKASEITGIPRPTIAAKLKNDSLIEAKKINNIWYINEKSLKYLLDERNCIKNSNLTKVNEAVNLTGMSRSTIKGIIANNQLPGAIKLKNIWYLTEDDMKLLISIKERSYISVKDIANETGMLEATIITKTKNNELPGAVKLNGVWQFTCDDIDIVKEEMEFIENSYTIKQATRMLNVNDAVLHRKIRNQTILEARFIRGIWYIPEKSMQTLNLINSCYDIEEAQIILNKSSESTMEIFLDNNCDNIGDNYYLKKEIIDNYNEFYTLEQASEICNIPVDLLYIGVKKGFINNKGTSIKYYISKNDVKKLVKEGELLKNLYSKDELMTLLNCNSIKMYYLKVGIEQEINPVFIFDELFFEKELIDNKINTLGGVEKFIEYYKQIRYINRDFQMKNEIITQDGKKYCSSKYTELIYNLNINSLRSAIKNKKIQDTFVLNNVRYIAENEINDIISVLENSISFSEIQKKLKVEFGENSFNSYKSISSYLKESDIFEWDMFGVEKKRVKVKDRKEFMNKLVEIISKDFTLRNIDNPYKRYELLVEQNINEFFKVKFKFTIETFQEYVFIKLNHTKIKKLNNFVSALVNTLEKILNYFKSDICDLTDKDILKIYFEKTFSAADSKYFTGYLRYIRSKYQENCLFSTEFKRVSKLREYTSEDIYTEEEWYKFSKHLTNIDLHIENSFSDYSYSKYWLYALLHFSIAWRSQDIIDIPSLSMLDIEHYSLEWFEKNEYTIADAQLVINIIKRHLDNTEMCKNQQRRHFQIFMPYVIPTALAFIITEIHRRKNNRTNLFSINNIGAYRLVRKLGNEIAGFNNRKAVRTLESYCFGTASQLEGYIDVAYSMGSYLRSHKANLYQLSDITSQYISAFNKDGEIANISKHLFSRGVFGWLYVVLLKLVDEDNYHDISELTTMVESIQSEISVFSVENMSRYFIEESRKRREVINELLQTPKTELKSLLEKIITGDLSSKQLNTYCLKNQKCPYGTKTNCSSCQYSIPTNYSLLTIGKEVMSLLNKLEKVEEGDYVRRQIYTYQVTRLLMILNEAKKHFDQIDSDYFRSFIPLTEIQSKLNEIKNTKFLVIN